MAPALSNRKLARFRPRISQLMVGVLTFSLAELRNSSIVELIEPGRAISIYTYWQV